MRTDRIALILSLLLLLIPVALTTLPPILDYPNHYARMWLLAGGAQIAPVSSMYRIIWTNASTNIGIDLIAAVLGGVLPGPMISRLVLFVALALPPLGAAMLNRRIFGTHWWQVALVLLAWNEAIITGLLNFQIGLGLALLGAAADPGLARRTPPVRFANRWLISVAILLVHPFGLLFYCLLLGALALGEAFGSLLQPAVLVRHISRALFSCIPAFLALACLVLLAPRLPGAQVGKHAWDIVWQGRWPLGHVLMMMIPFRTYDLTTDAVFLALFAAPVVVGLALGRIRLHAGLLITGATLLVLSNFMPTHFAGTDAIEMRLPCMAALTLAASLRPDLASSRRWHWIAVAAVLLVVTARTGWITHVWIERQADIAAVERVLLQVAPGSAVLAMENKPARPELTNAPLGRYFEQGQPTFWHVPTLAIVERQAFVPTLFTALGKQPVTVLPPWDRLAVAEGILPSVDRLQDPAAIAEYPYLHDWRRNFDFLLLINADMPNGRGPLPAIPELQLVADEGFARLYRIIPPRGG